MTVFPSAKHLASWAGMCPGNDESAGKRRSGKTREGSKWLSQTLVECAKSANRTKNTYLAAQYARLRVRRRANTAAIAVCHSILTAVWHMLSTGETYVDPGGDFFARRDPERTRKRLVGQLERLGYTVTVQERSRGSLNEIFSTAIVRRRRAWLLLAGDCESGGRDGERGTAGQSAHAAYARRRERRDLAARMLVVRGSHHAASAPA
jgi:hypothetical protein